MRAYQCDICGTFYTSHKDDQNSRIDPYTGVKISFVRTRLAVFGDSESKCLDVCPACMMKIQNLCADIRKGAFECQK